MQSTASEAGPLGLLWTETYRPQTLAEMALEDSTRSVLESYLQAGEVPHLLLIGPPGSGKTTLARIIVHTIDCRHITLNASSERGIDVVREKIGGFVTAWTPERWKVVFLDEADAMTGDAQTALRNLIEANADQSRFVLTANYAHKIIGPIQSRCQVLEFGSPPLKERYRILSGVLAKEGIAAEPAVVLSYAERFPDLRRMLMGAQRAWLATGKSSLPPAAAADRVRGGELLKLVEDRNWTALKRLTASGEFDPQEMLRDAFWSVDVAKPHASLFLEKLARGLHDSGYTPDPIVLFLGVAAEIMNALDALRGM